MANLKPAVELFVDTAKNLAPASVQKAAKELIPAINSNVSIDLSKFKAPLLTTDPNVNKFIDEFQLRNPENMVRFLVESHFAELESIKDGFSDLQEIDLINSLSFIGGAKRAYKRALKNPNIKEQELIHASEQLDQGIEQLEKKAELYIEKIREIDNRPRFSFFMKSKLDLKKVDTNNHCAKTAIKSIIEAVHLQLAIAAELKTDVESSDIKPFEDFKNKILSGDNCSLMHAYDDDAKSEFWLNLSNLMENVLDTADVLQEFVDSTEDSDFDFDNIEFN